MEQPFVNVDVSETEKNRIQREEEFWTGPRLSLLLAVSLSIFIATLIGLANL